MLKLTTVFTRSCVCENMFKYSIELNICCPAICPSVLGKVIGVLSMVALSLRTKPDPRWRSVNNYIFGSSFFNILYIINYFISILLKLNWCPICHPHIYTSHNLKTRGHFGSGFGVRVRSPHLLWPQPHLWLAGSRSEWVMLRWRIRHWHRDMQSCWIVEKGFMILLIAPCWSKWSWQYNNIPLYKVMLYCQLCNSHSPA